MVDTGELVRRMRSYCGLSMRQMAARAGTSAPAFVHYESGRQEPRLSTLVRMADAAGCELVVELRPRLTAPERRTLALHRLIAKKLSDDPIDVRRQARANLAVLRQADPAGRSSAYNDAWERLLNGPNDELTDALTSADQVARDLRQSSPFAGVLTDEERAGILQQEYDDHRAIRQGRE